MIESLPEKQSQNTLAILLYTQMSESIVLRDKMDKYRRKYPGPRKNYSKLLGIMDRYLFSKREGDNRRKLENERAQARQRRAAPAASAQN